MNNEELSVWYNSLVQLCESIINSYFDKKPIREKTLLDFSKLSMWVIKNPHQELPAQYKELSYYLSDYCQYQIKTDNNRERICSYVRAYQITNMVKIYFTEYHREKRISDEKQSNEDNAKLLETIFRSPGITLTELQRSTDFPYQDLHKNIIGEDINLFC